MSSGPLPSNEGSRFAVRGAGTAIWAGAAPACAAAGGGTAAATGCSVCAFASLTGSINEKELSAFPPKGSSPSGNFVESFRSIP